MPTRSAGSGALDLTSLLDGLKGVELIVVGGVAGTLHGTPRLTFDLDIVPDASEENLGRLAAALERLAATVREPGTRRLAVSKKLLHESALSQVGGQLRLRTRYGPLDILWRLHDGRGFPELKEHSIIVADDELRVRVIDLPALIEVKRNAGRASDLEDVRYLEAIRQRATPDK